MVKIPQSIFMKFTGFAQVCGLHECITFGAIQWINNGFISLRGPLVQKVELDSKNYHQSLS